MLQWYIIYVLANSFQLYIFYLVTWNTKVLLSVIQEVALGSTNKHFWHHRWGWQLSKGDAKKCQQLLGDYLNKWQVNKYQHPRTRHCTAPARPEGNARLPRIYGAWLRDLFYTSGAWLEGSSWKPNTQRLHPVGLVHPNAGNQTAPKCFPPMVPPVGRGRSSSRAWLN